MTEFTLESLAATIAERAETGDETSYTRKLIDKGIAKCAQKLGEEAVEAAIAAVERDTESLRAEAADLLYHLLVLLKASNVEFSDVVRELARRTGQSGLEEKAARNE